MARHRLKLHELRKILKRFGVSEDASRGKGGHTLFYKFINGDKFCYPIPTKTDVAPCYVRGCRKKFCLTKDDNVSDEEFFGKA